MHHRKNNANGRGHRGHRGGGGSGKKQVCRNWDGSVGSCKFGNNCRYAHPAKRSKKVQFTPSTANPFGGGGRKAKPAAATGIFGAPSAGGLFGAIPAAQPAGGSLFGGATAHGATRKAATPATGGGLFGHLKTGLFGQLLKTAKPVQAGKANRMPAGPRALFVELVIDRSGSMGSMNGVQFSGANDFLVAQQQALATLAGCEGRVSFTSFDDTAEVVLDGANLGTIVVPEPTMPQLLAPRGMTRLVDTMIERLTAMRGHLRAARARLGCGAAQLRGLFAVLTDGQDNMSARSAADFQRLLAEVKREFPDVSCLFLGANIDAIATAGTFGIAAGSAMTFGADPATATNAFRSMNACSARRAQNGSASAAGCFTPAERRSSAPRIAMHAHHHRTAPPSFGGRRGGRMAGRR